MCWRKQKGWNTSDEKLQQIMHQSKQNTQCIVLHTYMDGETQMLWVPGPLLLFKVVWKFCWVPDLIDTATLVSSQRWCVVVSALLKNWYHFCLDRLRCFTAGLFHREPFVSCSRLYWKNMKTSMTKFPRV